jgi:hypothetical protein
MEADCWREALTGMLMMGWSIAIMVRLFSWVY